MVSSKNVISRFLSSSISFTPAPSQKKHPIGKPPSASPNTQSTPNPQQKKIDELLKKQKRLTDPINKQITLLQKQQQQQKHAQGENPNDDPAYLYRQVRPLLSKMGLQNSVVNNKTQLVLGQTDGKNSLYMLQLRRQESITPDIISRIKRNEANFKEMRWTPEAITIYLWYPYTSDLATVPEGAPPATP